MAPAGLVVRAHMAAAPPVATTTAPTSMMAPSASLSAAIRPSPSVRIRDHGAALDHVDPGVLGGHRRQLADDPPTGRRATGVHDAPL